MNTILNLTESFLHMNCVYVDDKYSTLRNQIPYAVKHIAVATSHYYICLP